MSAIAYVIRYRAGTFVASRTPTASPPAHARSEHAKAAAAWIGATVQERGEALRDLLLLADRLPVRRLPERSRFPRIDSR